MDQMRKAINKMRENMRRANPVDDLVHRTDFPFTASINGRPLPPKFKMPSLDSYDGARDPCNHIATFKTTMHLQGVSDEIMCRAFLTTFKGFQTRIFVGPFLPSLKGQHECGSARYL